MLADMMMRGGIGVAMLAVGFVLGGCSSDDDASGSSGGAAGTAGSGGSAGSGGGSGNAGGTGASGGSGGAGGTSGAAGAGGSGGSAGAPHKTYVYVGTAAGGKGTVHVLSLNQQTGELTPIESTSAGNNASFMTLSPDKSTLYVADPGANQVLAFAVDAQTGKLSDAGSLKLNGAPVYVSTNAAGTYLFTAHYNQGAADVVSLNGDGTLGSIVDSKQPGAKAHSIVLDPSSKYVFVPNNGANTISQYVLDASSGKLTANSPASVTTTDGPRHLAFHPTLDFAYVMNEQGNSMTAYAFDAGKGTLSEIETEDALPPGAPGNSTGADVNVHPSGKFVYGSERCGAQSAIAVFSIGSDGGLTLVEHAGTHGEKPRNFNLTQDGKLLLVANQDSNNVVSFSVDESTGKLTYLTETSVSGSPSFVEGYDFPE